MVLIAVSNTSGLLLLMVSVTAFCDGFSSSNETGF